MGSAAKGLNMSRRDIIYNTGWPKNRTFYPAIRSIQRDTKFTVAFPFLCTVTDFSAGALPIGVKFCMAVRPHIGQVFSYFGGIGPGMAEFWGQRGAI